MLIDAGDVIVHLFRPEVRSFYNLERMWAFGDDAGANACIRGRAARRLLLHIVARGSIGRGPEAELVDRYLKRVAWPTKITELPDSGGKIAAAAPRAASPSCSTRKASSSARVAFAEKLERWRDDGVREARFLIGAADGFDDAERAGADLLLAFGRATWPHLLARAMLAEQLWRATSILANHPYHREG